MGVETIEMIKLDDVYIGIKASTSVCYELNEHFSFYAKNYKFHPLYKNKMWNGKIHLFNVNKRKIYLGLWSHIIEFAEQRDYDVVMDPDIYDEQDISKEEISEFLKILKLPHEPRENQLNAIHHCIQNNRCVLLSPTSSGKSMVLYSLIRWYDLKTLLIVPTQNLVLQMFNDFKDYSSKDSTFNVDENCHIIMAGKEKNNPNSQVYISTWQSVVNMSKEYFDQFGLVIVDEAHGAKAKSLTSIMEKCTDCLYKFGATGTLDDSETHEMVLTGLFGRIFEADKTINMMNRNQVSNLNIKCAILKYDDPTCKENKGLKYADEIKFITSHEKRNQLICKIAEEQKDTTLVLFQYLEHGKYLYEHLKKISKKPVYYIAGNVNSDDRELVRQTAEAQPGSIIVASMGTYSTGVNLRNLYTVIFASPSKAKIKILQSIGRVLRLGDRSNNVTLIDVVDDMSHKSYKNFALKHFLERINLYSKEGFKYKIFKISLSNK
jgi:superfamily II DNA or RNA helicase